MHTHKCTEIHDRPKGAPPTKQAPSWQLGLLQCPTPFASLIVQWCSRRQRTQRILSWPHQKLIMLDRASFTRQYYGGKATNPCIFSLSDNSTNTSYTA